MTVLLTGHAGFVGQHVQSKLGCEPLTIENGKSVDITDPEAVLDAVARVRPSRVIHLAAQSFVPESFRNPERTYHINFFGTLNLLNALQQTGFSGRFLYIGSGDTYGLASPDELPLTENHPLRPRSPYAVSKVAAEAVCYQWSQTGEFDVVMARPFNHIGPGQTEQFALSDFAKQLVEIRFGLRPPTLSVGDIDVTRDFTDVRDVVDAYVRLLEYGESGEIYNVSSGRERSLRSLLEILISQSGTSTAIESDPSRIRRSEQRRMYASSEKLRVVTGWAPTYAIEQTLNDLLDDWTRKLSA